MISLAHIYRLFHYQFLTLFLLMLDQCAVMTYVEIYLILYQVW
jgi:hypothetical protein